MLNLATPYFFQLLFGQFFEIIFCIFHDSCLAFLFLQKNVKARGMGPHILFPIFSRITQ